MLLRAKDCRNQMKLLKKSEILSKKSEEKRKEIVEGMKVAGQVDALREVRAQEEASLEKFRVATLSAIKEDIVALDSKKQSLQEEVQDLEERKNKALEPLDAAWGVVNAAHETNRIMSSELEADKLTNEKQGEELARREKQVGKDEERLRYTQEDADTRLKEAATIREAAENLERQSTQLFERNTSECAERTRVVESRENAVTDRENASLLKEEVLNKKESALNKETIRLRDLEAMFERNIKRLKK